jgi:hypothetical protein
MLVVPDGTVSSSLKVVGSVVEEEGCCVNISVGCTFVKASENLLQIFFPSTNSVSTPSSIFSSCDGVEYKEEGEEEDANEDGLSLRIFCVVVSQLSADISLIAET